MKIILMNISWISVLKLMMEKIFSFNVTKKNVPMVKLIQSLSPCMVLLMQVALISLPPLCVLKKLIHLLWKNVMINLIVNLKLMVLILMNFLGHHIMVTGYIFLDVPAKEFNLELQEHVNVIMLMKQLKQKMKNKEEKKKPLPEKRREKVKNLVKMNNKSLSKVVKDLI